MMMMMMMMIREDILKLEVGEYLWEDCIAGRIKIHIANLASIENGF